MLQRERVHCEQPLFYSIFLQHIASDMKANMVLSVRRSAGLGCTTTMVPRASTAVSIKRLPNRNNSQVQGSHLSVHMVSLSILRKRLLAIPEKCPLSRERWWSISASPQVKSSWSYWGCMRGLSAKERVARIASVDQAGASAHEVGDTQAAPESTPLWICDTSSPQVHHPPFLWILMAVVSHRHWKPRGAMLIPFRKRVV